MVAFAWVTSTALVIALLVLAWLFENFWMVFFWPALLMIGCQAIALCAPDWAKEWKFFTLTDFAYYVGIGAVVGLSGHYLADFQRVLEHDVAASYERAVKELPLVAKAQEETAKTLEQTERALGAIGAGVVGECLGRTNVLEKEPGMRNPPIGCEGPIAVLDVATRERGALISLNARKSKLEATIAKGNASPTPIPGDVAFFLLFKLLPCLLLCGVALKIGKTTFTLLTSH